MTQLRLTEQNRSPGFTRAPLRQDVLYNFCRMGEVGISVSKKAMSATRASDTMAEEMLALGLITRAQKCQYEQTLWESFCPIDRFDQVSSDDLYRHISQLRRSQLGAEAISAFALHRAKEGLPFLPNGIDQSSKKAELLQACDALIFVLTQPELFGAMLADLQQAAQKEIWVLCDPALMPLLPAGCQTLAYSQRLQEQIDKGSACLFFYGEEGLTACRGLLVDAIVHAVPTGFYAKAVTDLWHKQGCTVYIPRGLDITRHVPLTAKTRLNYRILHRLWQDQGDRIYRLSLEQLYRQFPQYFINIYSGEPSVLPFSIAADRLSEFDRQLDEALSCYLSSFPNGQYQCAYFDEALTRQPICYDGQSQPGILVQTVKVRQAAKARVIRCEKDTTPRQMFAAMQLSGTAIVSNFLFFMTPKLGNLYNELRHDRPLEQADAASGHLDYIRTEQLETFPLFSKACLAMKADGSFLFFNYRLGGGSLSIAGIPYRWEQDAVDSNSADLRIYTPYYSICDQDAQRDTYRKAVGTDRVNVVILQNTVTCIRKADVILPSVGVVLSLTEAAAAPLLARCKPLEDGYYDTAGLSLSVKLDPPEGIDPADWAQVRWVYGGGLTLIRNGEGLCDGDHMQQWFEKEGWTSPLSRQTQESNLHTLVKHPRTAIGCTAEGHLVVLVYSGRTWRSTGADYREMIAIARKLYPDIRFLMNCDGGGSAMLGMVKEGVFQELSFPSTSGDNCAGQVRPINTVFYIPIE